MAFQLRPNIFFLSWKNIISLCYQFSVNNSKNYQSLYFKEFIMTLTSSSDLPSL